MLITRRAKRPIVNTAMVASTAVSLYAHQLQAVTSSVADPQGKGCCLGLIRQWGGAVWS